MTEQTQSRPVAFSTRIDEDLLEWLRKLHKKRGSTITFLVNDAVRQYKDRVEQEETT